MGSSKKQTTGYRYYMGLHFGLCHGPVDSLKEVRAGDRRAWAGLITGNSTASISAGDLFGGDKKEGGLQGALDVMMGDPTQGQNAYLVSKLGSMVPAFRGILSAVWRGGQVSANNPYIKPWSFRVQRIEQGWATPVFSPENAKILLATIEPDIEYTADLLIRYDPLSSQWENAVNGSGVVTREAVSAQDFVTTSNIDEVTTPALASLTVGRFNNLLRDSRSFVENGNTSTACWESPVYPSMTGDMTFETMVYIESTAPRRGGWLFNWAGIGYAWTTPTNYESHRAQGIFSCWVTEGGALSFSVGVGADHSGTYARLVIQTSGCIPTDTWTHLAFVRVGTEWSIYANGELVGHGAEVSPMSGSGYFHIGAIFNQASPNFSGQAAGFVGYIAETRLIKTKGIYRKNFTPPSLPLPVSGGFGGEFVYGMNPAHIIYECLTNTSWGMGYPTSAVDETQFSAAADTLFAEGFGLCMIWNKQETIESFLKLVLEHAGGILYVDPTTGKFALKLIRDDYVASSLPVFGPSNLVSASDYQRKAWGETVNEVTIVYRDTLTNKDASVTVQDLANIQTQGAVVPQTKQYPGIATASLAQRVAMRDLNTLSTPLARVKLTANRQAWRLIPGDVFRLNWPEFGVVDVVFRVLEVNRGTLQDGTISVDAVEDVFGLPSNTYVVEQPGGWSEPTSLPQVATSRKVVEVPYWDLALSLSAADMAYLDPLSGYVETLAARPSGDSLNYEINSKTGAAEYTERTVAEFCPAATLSAAIGKTATAITFSDAIDVDLVTTGGYAIVGDEYVGITSVDADAGTATITRGLLDTVPADHSAGARIWFADGYLGQDQTEYASGEVVDVKMLPRTGLGELAIASAPADSITMARRHNSPYPPGLFRISGQVYPAALVDVALSVSWAHRDRLTQTAYLVQQGEGNIGPEAGTTYTVQLWNHATSTLIQGFTGVTGTSQAFTALPAGVYTLRVDLWSVRGGLSSYQKQSHVFDYININILSTEDLVRIATESGDVIELE